MFLGKESWTTDFWRFSSNQELLPLLCGEETKNGERKLLWETRIKEAMMEKEVDISMKREKLKHRENVVDLLKKQHEESQSQSWWLLSYRLHPFFI